jgi:dTMP kinase
MSGRLICFEGIDGSGKTTVAHRVAAELERKSGNAVFLERRGTDYPKDYQSKRMALYHQLIWEYGDDPIHELGDLHSLYIMAGWFAVLDLVKVRPMLTRQSYVLMDNWYYKFAARYALKKEVDFAHVLRCFGELTVPDTVVLLDVDPEVAVRRKSTFNLAETGSLDGFQGDPRESFVRYQSAVRDVLRTFAQDGQWIVVGVTQADSEEAVVARVLDLLPRER